MRNIFANKNLYFMLLVDSFLVVACFFLAYLIRFESVIPNDQLNALVYTLPYLLLIKIVTFAYFDLYRGMWRYTSLVDLINVLKAVVTSSLVIVMAALMVRHFWAYPRSIFVIDGFLTFLGIGGIRLVLRIYFAIRSGFDVFPSVTSSIRKGGSERKRLLILGAGDAGEKILREIRDNPRLNFDPMGFLDDDPSKDGKTIHGVPILGNLEKMELLRGTFDEILIAIPSSTGEQMRRIVAACEGTGKRYRTVPGMGELINGKVSVKTIRDVTMQDLLGREEVNLDQEEIKRYLHQKRILVTGAGGSIGAELVRQICRFHPEALALLDISELNLFKVGMECQQHFGFVAASSFLTDIRDKDAGRRVFRKFMPEVIFHAAAYKHVPIQELNPWEAVYNNVLGTRNLLELALEEAVERFVLVSTDKAVRPCNVMGATKRVAEMLVECLNGQSETRLMAVRFGNVLGSSGSAIPIFREQISKGGPVTVTHPEVTRYFMSIPEAAQLILQAGAMGEGGEIFILDMGTPIRIVDLAKDLIRLHGFEPEVDIPIQFIGLRPGEKLYEELITEGEGIVETGHQKIMVIRGNSHDSKALEGQIHELLSVARTYDTAAIKQKLKHIVPEYTPQTPQNTPLAPGDM